MDSIWTKTAQLPEFEPLTGDLRTGVLIVGGGMAGLLCAYWLAQAGVDYALVEADRICRGTTKNTTAKITSQHGLIYARLLREFGAEKARLYLEANQAALERYRTLCRGIDCDFEERDAYVYSLTDRRKLDRELEALSRLGFPAELVPDPPLPFPTAGAVKFPDQAQFHPLKFAAAIAKGLRIFEHTKVLELGPGKAVTNGGTVTADKIVIATHFPLLNKHGGYFLKLYQSRSYVLALEGAPAAGGMYVDESGRGLSLRDYGGYLLLGGGGHRTGKPGGGWLELEGTVQALWPQARTAARWAAQDCMSLDGVPYVGRYSRRTPDLYAVSGANKWGMTGSMAAASLLTDLILGREDPYEDLFCPSRTVLRPQLAVNLLESTLGLLTPTAPRCPHMGCALKYDAQEHSWDCPCHGSRFGEDGRLIEGPATDDKRM
ncbi:FAD-dependent oxidoreductase [uncultured Oscillibacter sp.]|uniref:FAD-dependent oxidoreductase n=1 Tax=uncultured Oscillibacter sp. TaxID=876091 RepID=UPI0025F5C441|nr:FAD-dependent oxidoreductase [uncultured Oscillibacter sp.]